MTYIRVIPRDLFNEANLLKCLGQLWIALDHAGGPGGHWGRLGDREGNHTGAPFDIQQDPSSGALEVANLPFTVAGIRWRLTRPLNSRRPFPLYAEHSETDQVVEVFTDTGDLTEEFGRLVGLYE